MSRDNGLSMLDANQVIQEVHNETEKALDVIEVNSLVPKRFGKVELTYVTAGNGIGEIATAKYYSDGAYQRQTITTLGDVSGSAHKTTVNFYNRTTANLANTFFTIYDASGAVTVWFDLDNTGVAPTTGHRLIEVNIATGDTEQQLAQKLNTKINTDGSFFSVVNDVMVMIVNLVVGPRTDSVDVNSGLVLRNIQGSAKQTLDGKYFLLYSSLNAVEYYVWYNVGGTSIDPAVASKTAIPVAIAAGASALAVTTATAAAIAATTNFLTNIDNDKLTITNKTIGTASIIQDVNCKFVSITTDVLGTSRELIVTLEMTYNVSNNLTSVERL